MFKKKIVTLLLSLLEGESDLTILNRMFHSLDFDIVKERMMIVYANFVKSLFKDTKNLNILNVSVDSINKRLVSDSFDGAINEAFELYILM